MSQTAFITGATRGIGRAIALRLAADGWNVAIASKTATPHPKLPGTLDSVAHEIEEAGGQALPLVCDIRDDQRVQAVVSQAAQHFGGIDATINNASAISLTPTAMTSMKRFDLMFAVNVRGTFCVSQATLPHLMQSKRAHILALSPPLDLRPEWFGPHVAYSMSKFGMSQVILGLSHEHRGRIAANALWPRTTIATAAVEMLGGEALMRTSRTPQILADAAAWILGQPTEVTGRFFIDDEVMAEMGITDLTPYAVDPSATLSTDLFVDPKP